MSGNALRPIISVCIENITCAKNCAKSKMKLSFELTYGLFMRFPVLLERFRSRRKNKTPLWASCSSTSRTIYIKLPHRAGVPLCAEEGSTGHFDCTTFHKILILILPVKYSSNCRPLFGTNLCKLELDSFLLFTIQRDWYVIIHKIQRSKTFHGERNRQFS